MVQLIDTKTDILNGFIDGYEKLEDLKLKLEQFVNQSYDIEL